MEHIDWKESYLFRRVMRVLENRGLRAIDRGHWETHDRPGSTGVCVGYAETTSDPTRTCCVSVKGYDVFEVDSLSEWDRFEPGRKFAWRKPVAPPRPNPIEWTAYHEAGHAVATIVEQRRLRIATIIPDDTTLGKCTLAKHPYTFRPDITITPVTADRLQREIVICLAGHAAQKHFSGRNDWRGASFDIQQAFSLADYLVGSQREHNAFLNWLSVQTEGLIQVHWNEIEAVAQSLLKEETLSAEQVRQVMREAPSPKHEFSD